MIFPKAKGRIDKGSLQYNGGDSDQHDAEHDLSAVIVFLVKGLASSTAMSRASATAEKETRARKNSCEEESNKGKASQSPVMSNYNLPFLQRIRENRRAVNESDHTCK
jgi:hypothetical protein